MQLEKLKDDYYKNIEEGDSELNSDLLGLKKSFTFTLSISSSLTGTFKDMTYDTVNHTNALSAYYHSFIMKSYACDAVSEWNGKHVFEWSATAQNIPNTRIQRELVNVKTLCALTSSLDNIALFTTKMKYSGDNIEPGTFAIYDGNGQRMFYGKNISWTTSYFDIMPDHNYYGSITSSLTSGHYLAWGLNDYGMVGIWSDNHTLTSSLSAVSSITFSGRLYFHNITANIVIEPDQFNTTTNKSFVEANVAGDQPKVNTTYITSVGIYNKWGELLIVAKPSHPIRKYLGVPITLKFKFDL